MDETSRDVFLAACDRADFERTVASPVDLGDHPSRPDALGDDREVRLWGTTAESAFERLDTGDLVVFYTAGEYVGVGVVGATAEDGDEWASEAFWEDTAATRLFTVEEFSVIAVPRAAFNRIFDYAESYTPGGLTRIADDRVTRRPVVIKRALERYSEE